MYIGKTELINLLIKHNYCKKQKTCIRLNFLKLQTNNAQNLSKKKSKVY